MLPPGGWRSVDLPVAELGPGFHASCHHVSLSFLTVTSAPPPLVDPPLGAGGPAAAGPGPDPDADAAVGAAPAPAVPSMVETSPCMKAHGGLLGELSNGQRSPLGQYTSPSPRRLWMYTLVQGKQNLHMEKTEITYNILFMRMSIQNPRSILSMETQQEFYTFETV